MKCLFAMVLLFNLKVVEAKYILSFPSDSSETTQTHSKLKISANYSSNNTYKGRKDTTNTPIISPMLKYTTKSNFFFMATLVNVPGAKKMFDELDLGLGQRFNFSDKWYGSISYSHFFFDSGVARIKAALQNDLSSYLGYDWNILYSQLYFDWSSGNNKFRYRGKKSTRHTSDVTFTIANSHQFTFYDVIKEGFDISIMPEADLLLGTQNYLATYQGKADPANKNFQQQASKFGITGYVFTAYFLFFIKNLTIDLVPYYTIPENLPQGESTSPYFIMSASVYYTFIGKK